MRERKRPGEPQMLHKTAKRSVERYSDSVPTKKQIDYLKILNGYCKDNNLPRYDFGMLKTKWDFTIAIRSRISILSRNGIDVKTGKPKE